MVAAAGTVGVKISARDAVFLQIASGRAVLLDTPGRRDVVRGDRIAEHRQNTRAVNIFHRLRLNLHLVKEWRQTDIGRILLPVVSIGAIDVNGFPFRRSFKYLRVLFVEHLGRDLLNRLGDLKTARPDILQIDRLTILPVPSGSRVRLTFMFPARA